MVLPWDQRERCRLRARLASGEEVALFLARGTVLRDGDLLSGEGGRVVRMVAAPEPTYLVRCVDAAMLARCAYHLGNRHTQAQVGPGWIRIRVDPVLKEMVRGLGAQVDEELAKFEPEAGAYAGGGHAHGDAHPGAGLLAPVPLRQKIHRPDAVTASSHERRQPAAPAAVCQPGAADRRLQLFAGPGGGIEEGLVHDAASARDWIVRGLRRGDGAVGCAAVLAPAAGLRRARRCRGARCGANASWPRATPPSSAPRPCRWGIR
jgi:urease accessory protein